MRTKPSRLIILICCLASAIPMRSQSGQRGLSLIVVPAESSAAELRSRLQSGASFEALAMSYSTDPSAARGGYIGTVDAGGLKPEFRPALEGLQPGAISPVTRTGNAYALLKWSSPGEELWRTRQDSASSAMQQGRYPEAAALFQEAVKQAETLKAHDIFLAESTNGLAQVYRYQLNYGEAEPLARRALGILEKALSPSHQAVLPCLINLAGVARATGKSAEAEQLYRRILAVRWGMPASGVSADRVLEKLADVLSLAQTHDPRLAEALRQYWQSIDQSRLNHDLYVGMRDRLVALQRLEEAESLMQRAIRQNPGSRYLQYRLGELYATWGKYQKAIEAFEAAGRMTNPDPDAERSQRSRIHERIGEMNFLLVRFDAAFGALTAALEIQPDSASARRLLGALHARRGNLEEAAAEYRRAIATDASNADAHDGLAQVNLTAGRYPEAVQAANSALALDAELQSSRYIKALALIRDGREKEGEAALADYERREAQRQESQSRKDDVAELDRAASGMLANQQQQEALTLLREGLRKHPQAAVLQLKFGLLQSRLGLHKEAAETFETMIRLKLDDFLVHRQLAHEYETLGNTEAGQRQRVLYLQRYDAALQGNEYR